MRLWRLAVLCAVVLAGAPATRAHQAAAVSVWSTERAARIDAVFNQYVDDGRLPGAVLLVLQDGKPVYERAFGWSDKEAGRKMAPDALFRIASQTKAITATAVMILMEEGKLLINDPVSKYLPAFSKTTVAMRTPQGVEIVPAKRRITIRDLLTHTAGISYGTDSSVAKLYEAKGFGPAAGEGWYFADKDEPVCDSVDRLGTLPFVAQPGEAWVYGYGNDIAGCIVERVAKQPLDAFIRERITAPLKMNDTFFFVPRDKAARLTAVYASGDDARAVRAPAGPKGQGDYVDGPRRNFSGGAGLVSTARDYARFLEMIRRGGELDGARVLSPKSAALLTVNAVGTLHSSTGMGYSLAFETTEWFGGNGLSSAGAFGWGGAYGSVYRVDPADKLTMVFMMQLMPNRTDLREKFPNLVYQALVR
ncbi:MAG: class A beta-lactamase-related serine hydrolase [Acidobacteria bacterium]|nr:MAG: class A beta-lactamase-related serine hydrolase [Acidobacteriota bacterium]